MKYNYSVLQLPDIKKQQDSDVLFGDMGNKQDSSPKGSIRIQSIEIKDFKSVDHGYIELFPIGKKKTTGKSNILALYGQNGSGKTTVIQVLYLLKLIMMGEELPDEAGRMIKQGKESANIRIVFEYNREGEEIIEYITYSFSLAPSYYDDGETETVQICNEVISLCKRDAKGKLIEKTRKLFDTNSNNKILNTSVIELDVRQVYDNTIRKERFQIEKGGDQVFHGNRDDAVEYGASVLFYQGLDWIDDIGYGHLGEEDEALAVVPNRYSYINLLKSFAKQYLFVAGANLFNAFSDSSAPLLLRRGFVETHVGDEVSMNQVLYIARCLVPLNKVLSAIIPGLIIDIKTRINYQILEEQLGYHVENNNTLFEKLNENLDVLVRRIMAFDNIESLKNYDENNAFSDPFVRIIDRRDDSNRFFNIEFYSRRGNTVTPLDDESEGIKHIIYDLDLFIAAYNDPGVTVAIDEFDAGVFEYLLGELLKTFEQHGKGQLIFTSHNLRPLEVLDRSFICFTTTNPENRYIRMKYINQTNNLRDVYYRQILVGEQNEDLYDYVNSYELMEALDWAGEGNEQSET